MTSGAARRRWKHKTAESGHRGDGSVVMNLKLGCGCVIGNRVPLAESKGRRWYFCPNGHGLRLGRPDHSHVRPSS